MFWEQERDEAGYFDKQEEYISKIKKELNSLYTKKNPRGSYKM